DVRLRSCREGQADTRAGTEGALYPDLSGMTLEHSVHHGQAEPRPPLTLGSEERLEAPLSRLLIHADSRIHDVDANMPGIDRTGAQRERAAVLHGIDRIQDEIGEGVPQLALDAQDRCKVRG